MYLVGGLALRCLQILRSSIRRRLAAIAFCSAFAMLLLSYWSRDSLFAVQPNRTVDASNYRNAFYLNVGATNNDGGLGRLVLETSQASQPVSYNPYPLYNSAAWKTTWTGNHQQCVGGNGSLLAPNDWETAMTGFRWNQSQFPTPIFGSYEAWGLDWSICADRYSRYAAYGYAEEGTNAEWFRASNNVQWEHANWASLQQDCLQRNANRYQPWTVREKTQTLHQDHDKEIDEQHSWENKETNRNETSPRFKPRTAVILRTWLNRMYTEDDLHYIRAMITELSLLSGAEYEVVVLVDAKDTKLPHPTDRVGLDNLKLSLPQELRDLAVFFNSEILEDWYPKIDVHVAILQYFQPVQIFSRLNPQYEFIWQFEMDSRYTGHFYSFLEQATTFAKQQPRKNLWERNSYFYIPAVHGSWDDFIDQVDQSMMGSMDIWGPRPVKGIDVGNEVPKPPQPDPEDDLWNWGVGEEADVITWLPQFDPQNTRWPFADRVYNFRQKKHTPRRASVVAMSRVSARLLRLMHADKIEKGLGLASEMSPTSWALYYGLKAVQVPQPIYHAHYTDPIELNRRANSGKPGAISGGPNSIWSWGQHNDILMRTSYMFGSEFPDKLYRAWLGYDDAEKERDHRLCLPPMFLHPVKNTRR